MVDKFDHNFDKLSRYEEASLEDKLSKREHNDPDLHLIGESLSEPQNDPQPVGTASIGESPFPAREDHSHEGLFELTFSGNPSNIGYSNSAGSSEYPAKTDHVHNTPNGHVIRVENFHDSSGATINSGTSSTAFTTYATKGAVTTPSTQTDVHVLGNLGCVGYLGANSIRSAGVKLQYKIDAGSWTDFPINPVGRYSPVDNDQYFSLPVIGVLSNVSASSSLDIRVQVKAFATALAYTVNYSSMHVTYEKG